MNKKQKRKNKKMTPILGYWKFRGVAQSIRYMLEYLDKEYIDRIYEHNEHPGFDQPSYNEIQCRCDNPCERHTEDLTVPYFIDKDGVLIIGKMHIINHIALRQDLVGTDIIENEKATLAEIEAVEMRKNWNKLVYDRKDKFEDRKIVYINELNTKLTRLSDLLGDESWWFAGITLTYVDFMLYELIDINQSLFPDCLNSYHTLQEFKSRFENLFRIESYLKSSKFMKDIINGLDACYGTNPEYILI